MNSERKSDENGLFRFPKRRTERSLDGCVGEWCIDMPFHFIAMCWERGSFFKGVIEMYGSLWVNWRLVFWKYNKKDTNTTRKYIGARWPAHLASDRSVDFSFPTQSDPHEHHNPPQLVQKFIVKSHRKAALSVRNTAPSCTTCLGLR